MQRLTVSDIQPDVGICTLRAGCNVFLTCDWLIACSSMPYTGQNEPRVARGNVKMRRGIIGKDNDANRDINSEGFA